MSRNREPATPIGTIAERVRQLRNRKGWSAAQLGEELTRKGIPWDRFTVRSLEAGKRQNVTIQEFLALSVVLDVAPVHLLFPLQEGAYEITPNGSLFKIGFARHWFRGDEPYPRGDRQMYFSERPEEELQLPDPPDQAAMKRSRRFIKLMNEHQEGAIGDDEFKRSFDLLKQEQEEGRGNAGS